LNPTKSSAAAHGRFRGDDPHRSTGWIPHSGPCLPCRWRSRCSRSFFGCTVLSPGQLPFRSCRLWAVSYSRPIPIRYERSRRRPGWPTKARLSGEWSWSSPLGVDAGHGIYSASFERPRATSTAARRVKSSSWFRIGHPETPISEPLCTGPSHDAGRAVVSSPMVVRRASLADGKVGKVGPEVAERRVGPVW